jgi:hypothetical protein
VTADETYALKEVSPISDEFARPLTAAIRSLRFEKIDESGTRYRVTPTLRKKGKGAASGLTAVSRNADGFEITIESIEGTTIHGDPFALNVADTELFELRVILTAPRPPRGAPKPHRGHAKAKLRLCGDGQCGEHETELNCPQDCASDDLSETEEAATSDTESDEGSDTQADEDEELG